MKRLPWKRVKTASAAGRIVRPMPLMEALHVPRRRRRHLVANNAQMKAVSRPPTTTITSRRHRCLSVLVGPRPAAAAAKSIT